MINKIKSAVKRRFEQYFVRKIKVPVLVPVFKNELLKGRRAFITGGSKGIGCAIAHAFLSSGSEVVITGRDELALKEAVDILSGIGPRIGYCVLDNCIPEKFEAAVKSVVTEYGEFDILVNNGGFTKGGGLFDSTVESYDKVFDSVLRGAWFMSQLFAKRWIEKHIEGNILNICSTSSLRPGYSPYTMCKWGERAMTIGLAKRLIPYNIVVNGIGPGVTNVKRLVPDANAGISHPYNPSGRYATEEEIANMAVVLTSRMGRMVVGDIVYMGGGAGVITVDDEG